MFDFQEELKKLPDKPGVYIMHDSSDEIIYVGNRNFSISAHKVESYHKTHYDRRRNSAFTLLRRKHSVFRLVLARGHSDIRRYGDAYGDRLFPCL